MSNFRHDCPILDISVWFQKLVSYLKLGNILSRDVFWPMANENTRRIGRSYVVWTWIMLIKHFRETCVGTVSVGNYPYQMILFFDLWCKSEEKKTTKRNIEKKNRNKKKTLVLSPGRIWFFLFVVEVKNLSTDSVK